MNQNIVLNVIGTFKRQIKKCLHIPSSKIRQKRRKHRHAGEERYNQATQKQINNTIHT